MAKVYRATDVGKVRPINEDSAGVCAPDIYIVADGMGGHAAGEVASRILVESVEEIFGRRESVPDEHALAEAIDFANGKILTDVRANRSHAGMGTTATVFHHASGTGFWAHVGDSRLYLLHGESLRQITRDHSYVEELVALGEISEEEARVHPQRSLLTRAVGVDERVEVDTGRFSLAEGDRVLLCTDGLTNMVPNEGLREVLRGDSPDPARTLVDRALDAGGLDNVTAIVLDFR